jgi:CheY-like chemotaxis protein
MDKIVNILIVEDDMDLQNVYAMILGSQGYRVKTANDGLEGLNILHSFTPDLILLDYFMPVMDGKTFLQNYDASQFPNTKIILASNVSDQHIIDELLGLGAHTSVLKADLAPSQLLQLVDTVVLQ